MTLTEQIVDIAETIEMGDPIDWGMLTIDEHDAYTLMATNVLDNYLGTDPCDQIVSREFHT